MFENGEDDDPKGEERMIQKMRKALKKVPNASHAHQEPQKSFFKQPIVCDYFIFRALSVLAKCHFVMERRNSSP